MQYPDPTPRRPTGIESFDHSDLAALAEYQGLGEAMDLLAQSVRLAQIPLGQPDWPRSVVQLAAAIPFADECEECGTLTYSHAARVEAGAEQDSVLASYRCSTCGHDWTCGWPAEAPDLG